MSRFGLKKLKLGDNFRLPNYRGQCEADSG